MSSSRAIAIGETMQLHMLFRILARLKENNKHREWAGGHGKVDRREADWENDSQRLNNVFLQVLKHEQVFFANYQMGRGEENKGVACLVAMPDLLFLAINCDWHTS